MLKTVVYGTVTHVPFLFNRTTALRGCMWVEINARVNYPIKHCLVRLEENGEINIDGPHHKFCISWFTFHVTLAVQAWNDHPVPG